MVEEPPRSRAARAAAERALVRLVRQYGELPEFVVLGGLVPELLCSGAPVRHAGTTDLDPAEAAADAVTAVRFFCKRLGIGT